MNIESLLEPGHYLYAIADAVESPPVYGNIGINGAAVYVISQGPLAAVVSDMTEKKIRPERKNLAAHNVVI